MIQYQGILKIEGAEFWLWVQKYLKNNESNFETPVFEEYDVMIFDVDNGCPRHIPNEVFWQWVNETYMPKPAHECLWNKPFYNKKDHWISIQFAAGSEHPMSWAKQPEWANS